MPGLKKNNKMNEILNSGVNLLILLKTFAFNCLILLFISGWNNDASQSGLQVRTASMVLSLLLKDTWTCELRRLWTQSYNRLTEGSKSRTLKPTLDCCA